MEILGILQYFDLCQISPNIENNDVGWHNLFVKRSNISFYNMLGERLVTDRIVWPELNLSSSSGPWANGFLWVAEMAQMESTLP